MLYIYIIYLIPWRLTNVPQAGLAALSCRWRQAENGCPSCGVSRGIVCNQYRSKFRNKKGKTIELAKYSGAILGDSHIIRVCGTPPTSGRHANHLRLVDHPENGVARRHADASNRSRVYLYWERYAHNGVVVHIYGEITDTIWLSLNLRSDIMRIDLKWSFV